MACQMVQPAARREDPISRKCDRVEGRMRTETNRSVAECQWRRAFRESYKPRSLYPLEGQQILLFPHAIAWEADRS
ncbi:hypothetical protein E4U30_006461 [Claviceps sp. LM220 group G6]|nr:hypothetical protein E4U14_007700 [Claviceps sp. LM454 group G7]KAG6099530.1 hypothetical protein E4U30_006461 [Claviceps sp. LM220 group G6]KAG6100007.1 hypothetical protein E4U31_004157 [Claviceps sp. LM219 group G6]